MMLVAAFSVGKKSASPAARTEGLGGRLCGIERKTTDRPTSFLNDVETKGE